jgi:hypothetical protein
MRNEVDGRWNRGNRTKPSRHRPPVLHCSEQPRHFLLAGRDHLFDREDSHSIDDDNPHWDPGESFLNSIETVRIFYITHH